MHDQLIDLLLTGTIDTLIMVGASAFFCLTHWSANGSGSGQYL